jgi:predicted nucleic acid-binding Zn finger protein
MYGNQMMDVWELLACNRSLTPEIRAELERRYNERGRKALKAVDELRVKRYRDFFVVVGHGDEYVVDEEFCTCRDFLYRGRECAHLLAVRIAKGSGIYEDYDTWYYLTLEERD